MRKSMEKGLIKFLMSLCFCLLALVFSPVSQGEAASKAPSCVKTQTAYVRTGAKDDEEEDAEYGIEVSTMFIYIKNLSSDAKITNVKSSNKKIVAYSYVKEKYHQRLNAIGIEQNYPEYWGNGIKPGDKTKISFTVTQNKKKYNLSCTVTFKKVPSIFKSFKIDGKSYTSELNTYSGVNAKKSGSKIKISYKAAAGYKVDKIYAYYGNGKKKLKVKNGQTISTKNLSTVTIFYSPKKKPANYKKPFKWISKVSSPLQSYVFISFR